MIFVDTCLPQRTQRDRNQTFFSKESLTIKPGGIIPKGLIARKKGIRLIIAFDEFQEIEHLDGLEPEKLKSPGHVRKALKSLEGMGLIERNKIWDIFFREWVKRNFVFV